MISVQECSERSLGDYISSLASKSPTPGGGGASAVCGALGMALGNMVISLTLGKKKYEAAQADLEICRQKAEHLQSLLLELASEDEKAFLPLSQAYSLPSGTAEEKKRKADILEDALMKACSVPLKIMDACAKSIELLEEIAEKGNIIALSDAGVGFLFCSAALQGAAMNIYINTGLMNNKDKARELLDSAVGLVEEYKPRAASAAETIAKKLMRRG
jgi:formiminotetrahydrofolate cyclodeaminase